MKNVKTWFVVFLLVLAAAFALVRLRIGTTATILWTDVHQSIDGFGGSVADFLMSLTPAQADFFYTQSGLGFSILRTQIIPDQKTCDVEFKEHGYGCTESNGQILDGELESAKLAVARGAMVFATPWSPPGVYKSNGSFKNGGYLLHEHYGDWAREIASYVPMMSSHGIPIYAVSVQNEPNLSMDYGSCLYTAEQIHDFVPYLHSALEAAGAGSTKIIIAEEGSWDFSLTDRAMADPKIAPMVGVLGAHGYSTNKIRPRATGSDRLWQTEDSSSSAVYDGSMQDAMGWAIKIHDYLTVANVNAWMWWFLTDMPNQGEGTDNAALTDINGVPAKRAFASGQWSKFVRPGWLRIGVSYFGPLRVSAFKDPHDRAFAVVAVNPARRAVSQKFSLRGLSVTSLTPYVTSESLSLSEQPTFAVSGDQFTYTLPALSVVTFAGTTGKR